MRQTTLRRAYHEAGHAVIAHHLGYWVSRVTIRARGEVGGECYCVGFLSGLPLKSDEESLLRCLNWTAAGMAAEAIAVGLYFTEGCKGEGISAETLCSVARGGDADMLDTDEELRHLAEVCPSWVGKEEEIRELALEFAFRSLISVWPTVEAVTVALVQKKTLRHEDIERLCGQSACG